MIAATLVVRAHGAGNDPQRFVVVHHSEAGSFWRIRVCRIQQDQRTAGIFSGDGVRFLQAGERLRVWRTKSLIRRLQAEARRQSLTDGAAVAERRVLGW